MMKDWYLGGIIVMLMALVGITAFGNETSLMDNSDVNRANGFSKAIGITWKLYGFATVGEDEVQKVKPEMGNEWRKDEQYTILFKENGTLEGHTFSNDFFGEYSIDGNSLVIGDLWATEIGEAFDGAKYYEALYSPLTHVFEIRNDQLLLYYNEGQNYLLFGNATKKEYDTILKEGMVWRMEAKMVVAEGYSYSDAIYTLRGDTLINDIPFKGLYIKSWLRSKQEESADWCNNGFIGEQNGKVYFWAMPPIAPKLVMDFTLNVGDTFVDPSGYVYIVKNVSDTILSRSDDQRPRRCISLVMKYKESFNPDIWIEGVGSVYGGIRGILSTNVMGAYPKLLRCEDNGVCIYESEDYQTSIRIVQDDQNRSIKESNKKGSYLLNGLPTTPSTRGIYIQDGKKVIK